MVLRPPPSTADIDPLIVEIPAGTVLFRAHAAHRDATGFNPGMGTTGRFHPLLAGDPPAVVPTLYAASTIPGALSESIFHDVPYRGPAKRILVSRLQGVVVSAVLVTGTPPVALLTGAGSRRLGVRRRDLIEGGPRTYPRTVDWAAALHDAAPHPAGLTWMSRQDDAVRAYVLFGDRVPDAGLVAITAPQPLATGIGLELVEQAASDAGIAVVR